MAGENNIYDITEDPGNAGAFSAITDREPEFHEVTNTWPDEVPIPGFVGFQLDDRPAAETLELWFVDSDYLGTDTLFDTDSDGASLEIITSGTPNATQARLYESNGWVLVHTSRIYSMVMAIYDSYGSNYSARNIRKLVGDTAVSSVISSPEFDAAVTDAVDDAVGNVNLNTVRIWESKASGTGGGNAGAATWNNRATLSPLNTLSDPLNLGFGVLSSGQFILQPGRYVLNISAPSFYTTGHRIRLYNVTSATVAQDEASIYIYGTSSNSDNSGNGSASRSGFSGVIISILVPTTYRIEHYTAVARVTNGLGYATTSGVAEIYGICEIRKIS